MKTQQTNDPTSWTGVDPVKVNLKPISFFARLAYSILQPTGDHYVKFTSLPNGHIKVQFCNANGDVSGDSPNDYLVGNTNHFWKNRMPNALNLANVTFSFNEQTGVISTANTIQVKARANNNPNGLVPATISQVQNSGPNARVLTTNNNNRSKYAIHIKLDFALDFNCEITKG